MRNNKRYLMIALLFIGYLLVFVDKTVIGVVMIDIQKDLSLTTKEVGYITGFFFLSYSLFQIPAGWLNDRIGYKKVLLLSLTMIGICAFLFGFIGSTIAFLVSFRFLAGIGHSGYPCSCAKAVSSNFEPDERPLAQSILLSSSGVALIIGPFIINYAVMTVGWRLSYVNLAIVAFVIMLCVFLFVPSAKKAESNLLQNNQPKPSYLSLLANPVVILLFIAIFGVNIANYGLMVWLPKYLVDVRGLEKDQMAYMIAIGGLAQWISSIASTWVVTKFMKNREKYAIFVCSVISAVCILLVYYSNNIVASAVFLFFTYIFLMTSFVTSFTLPMKWLPSNTIGSIMGFVNTGGTLGGFIAPIVIGILLSTTDINVPADYSFAFMFLAAGMILTALVVLPLKKPQH